ncbi:cell division protein FtsK [Bacillus hwajinpoensis]|uniref:Cell division protein FtsK n=2 Tax=Guptibacillus hwajinpoensis TaxID=208199 RepID=A0A845EW25_9BACL|nr:cell division protein FtsK [Pseudalkalibacillus hwajinpoensis]
MESANRKNEARIVHQYPREGNFRFPLIPDQSNNQTKKEDRKESNYPKKEQGTSNRTRPEKKNEKLAPSKKEGNARKVVRDGVSDKAEPVANKKFSGVNFKPSEIPSPIYGFSKRPVTEKMEDAAKKSNPNPRYTSLDKSDVIDKLIQEPVPFSLTEEESTVSLLENAHSDQESSQMNEAIASVEKTPIDQQETVIREEEKKTGFGVQSDKSHDQEMDEENLLHDDSLMRDVEESSHIHEDASKVNETVNEQDEVIEAVINEEINEEPTLSRSENEVLEADDSTSFKQSGTHEDAQENDKEMVSLKEPAFEEERVPENNVSEQQEVLWQSNDGMSEQEVEQEQETPEPTMSVKEQSHKQGRQEESRPKPQVPYNVMMLANDRRHVTKKPVTGADYKLPPISLLDIPPRNEGSDDQWLEEQRELLESTLANFNVQAKVVGATMGPTVTRFEVQPSPGVKVNKITNLSDDIKLSLAARDIRMEAPIPGKNAIGIEVPNPTSKPVFIREIVRSGAFQTEGSLLNAALGFDIAGEAKITDIQKMPHGLIAGATGSGKSVCINSILVSLLLKANPNDVKMMLIDPKMVELAPYNGLPHLVTPVINDVKEATTALKWAVDEMEERYEKFAAAGVRDIKRYNERAINHGEPQHKLPYIVIVIDELADLMMVSPQDVEDAICRIAQKARACGIHLLVATQRPSVDVITGLIKANIPTRIAFSVSSQIDSRTILDTSGAEKLLGKGDMLCLENGSSKPVRLQGNFVSDEEIERVTSFVRKQRKPNYLIKKEDLMKKQQYDDQEDDLFEEACMWALEQGQASSSALQRRFRIGFNRAARLIEMMEERGLVSEAMGSKPRSILMSKADFEEAFSKDMHV